MRAQLAFEAMQKYYYIAGLRAVRGGTVLVPLALLPGARGDRQHVRTSPALKGAYAHELHARLIGLRNVPGHQQLRRSRKGRYTSTLPAFDGTVAPPAGPGGTKYYDDNDWVGIELARVYELTHSPAVLGYAEGIMAFEMAGWQENPGLACPGGIPFSNSPENSERNTVTNAPTAELALQLYRITHNAQLPAVRRESLRMGAHLPARAERSVRRPHRLHGTVEPTPWSYNQGAMIGAGTLLYQATGNSAYLYQAAPDREGGARLLHPRTARHGKPVLRIRLLPQPAVPGLRHARPARARRSRRTTSTTPGSTCA